MRGCMRYKVSFLILFLLQAGVLSANLSRLKRLGFYLTGENYPESVPAFEINSADMQNHPFRLSALKGKVVILFFWTKWYPLSEKILRNLKQFQEEQKNPDVVVVTVNIRNTKGQIDRFLGEHKDLKGLKIIRDPSGSAGDRYGVVGFPVTYLIDGRGMIRSSITSEVNWSSSLLRETLKEMTAVLPENQNIFSKPESEEKYKNPEKLPPGKFERPA